MHERTRRVRGVRRTALIAMLLVAAAVPASAQRRRGYRQPINVDVSNIDFKEFNVPYDGRFTFVRLRYTPDYMGRGGSGSFLRGVDFQWDHDYPRAERHLTRIVSELTAIHVNDEGHNILTLDDPDLLKYPAAYLAEAGRWTLTDAEADGMRDYLLKGGFVIFDDFATQAWFNFEDQMRRVLPDHQLIQLDASHPIFHSFFEIETLDEYYHPYYYVPSIFYGIFEDNDPTKRMMVIVNYNNDIGESWEFNAQGFIPIDLTNKAYKLGINYIVYAMTH